MMTEFKVGDRVRYIPCIGSNDWQNITLTESPSKDDKRQVWFGVDTESGEGGFAPSTIEKIESVPSSELAELRAFRDTALASGYVPPVPVDPDVAEAQKIAKTDCWGYGDFTPNDGSAIASIYAAIKRGRELAAQGAGK